MTKAYRTVRASLPPPLPRLHHLSPLSVKILTQNLACLCYQKAKLYHPDLNKDTNAQAKFVAVKEAYECLRDPSRRAHYDSTFGGGDGSPFSHGSSSHAHYRHAGFRAPSWESSEAERKLWEEMRSYRYYNRANWEEDRRRMDDQMRKSEQTEALRRLLQPYFNLALAVSLVALGITSLYLQYRARSKPRTYQNFAPAEDDIPTYFSKHRQASSAASSSDSGSPQHSDPYHPVDPHRKYQTKWEEINESVKRRDDFYRALLRGDQTIQTSSNSPKSTSI